VITLGPRERIAILDRRWKDREHLAYYPKAGKTKPPSSLLFAISLGLEQTDAFTVARLRTLCARHRRYVAHAKLREWLEDDARFEALDDGTFRVCDTADAHASDRTAEAA
jgi:hypothetical protein